LPDFFTVSPEVSRAVEAVQHEMKLERRQEALRALVELRQRLGGFGNRVVAMVYVPQCEDCYATERHRMEADDSTWEPPDIHPKTWRKDLSEYAIEKDVRRTYREMKDELRDHPVVRCDTCEQEILYWRDTVYVGSRPFENHFPELVGEEDRDPPANPPEYVRRLVYDAYAGKCAGCGVQLAWNEKTMDHIRPKHRGGPGTLENIQLACAKCNNERKGGDEPGAVHVWLDLLLVAQGPEFHSLARLAGL
jgi:5-methylcytosine-specific restriction endonuclease McrA